ncbi:MAG: apolipoprotein N-acyltransferase [Acidobacteriia bacterium]|nr:apolipoprotein N-acyltransferase [Terriglobia bacterium]
MNLLLALVTAALLIFTFPGFNFAFLAPIAVTPLLIAVAREKRPLRRFLIGWAAGFVFWLGVCYWIENDLARFGGVGPAVAWALELLFALAKGLHLAVFALGAGVLIRRGWAVPAVAAWWVAVEVTHGSLGFAWLALGNAGIDMAVPLRLAPITGVWGLSFVFMMMATALALAFLRRPRLELLWLLLLPFLIFLPPLPRAERGQEAALLMQPNISESEEWTPDSVRRMEDNLAALTLRGVLLERSHPPSIVVWPEVPAPLYYDEDLRFRDSMNNLARAARANLLLGVVAHTLGGRPLNSAQLISPAGLPVSRYDKVNLVPFGEFVPWPFNTFVDKISTETGDFAAGKRVTISPVDGHRIGAFICYESVFPNFVRRFAAGGAEVLFNISNDGWFGKSAAREQHLRLVRMRAAENRRWILRSTNDGITATIDSAGRLRGSLPLYTEATSYAGFSYISEKTVYTKYGDWFALLCATIALVCLVAERML